MPVPGSQMGPGPGPGQPPQPPMGTQPQDLSMVPGYNNMPRSDVQVPGAGVKAEPLDGHVVFKTPKELSARQQIVRDLITNFTYALGKGLSAPRHQGVGAALLAPFELEDRNQTLELQRAGEEQRTMAVKAAMQKINQQDVQFPAQLQNLYSQINQRNSNTDVNNARVPQIQAQTQNIKTDTAKKQLQFSPNGDVFRIEVGEDGKASPVKIQGVSTVDRIEITKELAASLHIPERLIGEKLRPVDINQLSAAANPDISIFTDDKGVEAYDRNTQEIKKLGGLPPSQTGMGQAFWTPVMNDYGIIQAWYDRRNPTRMIQAPDNSGFRATGAPQVRLTRGAMFQDMIDKLDILDENSKKHPGVIGPLAGRGVDFLDNIINLDPEINQIFAISKDLADLEGRKRSGATIRPDEEKNFRQFAPFPYQTSSAYYGNIERFRNYLKTLYQNETGKTYTAPADRVAPDAAKKPPASKAPVRPTKPKASSVIEDAFPGGGR